MASGASVAIAFAILTGGPVPAGERRASTDKSIDASIRRYRTGEITVRTRPGARVKVTQLRHEFHFGAALSKGIFAGRFGREDTSKYKEVFARNFNAGVFENAMKWKQMEPRRGRIDHSVVDSTLEWADEHGIPVRGHCIFWGVERFVQDWIRKLDDDALREALRRRAKGLTSRYRGRVPEYDLNNEMIHGNMYAKRLGPGITADMARWAKEGDPGAVLYLNDYDILTGRRLKQYVAHIDGLIKQGVPVGGIGVQGHLHGDTFDRNALRRSLDALARFKLPIKVTEFNFPGQRYKRDRTKPLSPAQEEAKAARLVEYYRICFANPAVEGMLMWGFWEGQIWLPHAALWKRDWTPTPAAEAYRELVFDRWWTRFEGKADAAGVCKVRAFFGRHAVEVGGRKKEVVLSRKVGSASVRM
jgi:GH35 family endo-1,4-beta-xylanase